MPRTRALVLGNAIDCLLFDGREVYARKHVMQPKTYMAADGTEKKWTNQSNTCKQWTQETILRGGVILTYDEAMMIEAMLLSLQRHPLVAALLAQGRPQVTFRRESERYGMQVQVRPDWFSEQPISRPDLGLDSGGLPYLADLKSTEDFNLWFDVLDPESPRSGKPVTDFGYYRQAGMVQWVANQDVGRTAHYHIVVEKKQPYRVGVVQLTDEYLELGFNEVDADLQRLKACLTANVWPGSVTRVISLAPPQWLLDRGVRQAGASVDVGAPTTDLDDAVDPVPEPVAAADDHPGF